MIAAPPRGLVEEFIDAHSPKRPVILDRHEASVSTPNDATVDDACKAFFTNTPSWLVRLMQARNAVVKRLGFSVVASGPPQVTMPIPVGDTLSVFTVIDRTADEILLGTDDDRFSMRLSLELDDGVLAMTTVAFAHDAVGNAYLRVVKAPHGPIASMMTRRVAAHI